MPFVPGYQYDLFISYRHVDNQHGWVTRLAETLRELLTVRRRPGRSEAPWEYSVFYDSHELKGHEEFNHRLESAVAAAAAFVVVLSGNYLTDDSDWCARELARFRQATAGRPHARERVFVVHNTNVDVSCRPADLRDLI